MYPLIKTKSLALCIGVKGELLVLPLIIFFSINLPLLKAKPAWNVHRVICNDSLYYTQELGIVNAPLKRLSLNEVRELEIYFDDFNENVTVQYKLSCFDEDWNISENKKIRYTNIPKGRHELYVKNNFFSDTLSLEVLQTANLLVKKPIQNQWWFSPLLTFCLLLIPFTVTYFIALNRSRRNLKVEMVRNQIASDLHDDVGVNLSAIKNFTEILKMRTSSSLEKKQLNLIQKIENYSDETLNKLQDTVWAINPMNDSVEELIDKMKNMSLAVLSSKNIQLHFHNNYQETAQLHFDMQQRHNLFMVFKESIHNVVKHSQASQTVVNISNQDKYLAIQVKDNGIGFDKKRLATNGNGLRNFQQRAESNYMEIEIQSTEGLGTTIDIRISSLA